MEKSVKQMTKEFDDYNTVAKRHTLNVAGQKQIVDEMVCGCIKINGTEQFSSYDEMLSCLQSNVSIETEVVK